MKEKETLKLYNSITNVNNQFIEEAQAKTKKKKSGWLRWGAMAACLCLAAVGAVVLSQQNNLTPDIDLDYEEPTMPEPFDLSNPSGGDWLRDYTEEYVLRFENLTSDILELVPRNDFTAWLKKHDEEKIASEERISPLTVLAFVMEFDISKEQLLSVIAEDNDPSWTITREDVDVIYSGDMELINKTFINEYSVLHNNKIYTPEWFYEHTTAEYIELGFTDDEVSYVMEKMKDLPFTAEAKKAIEDKYRKFQASISEVSP
ncbi:MAG: hypothetical protein J1F60_05205 [Oscillospiraceae bacterium]|nr:hypothetical protein [Oscillospiraceae bacterium]